MSYSSSGDDRLESGPDLTQDNPRVIMVRRLRAIIVVVLIVLMFPILFMQWQTGMSDFNDMKEKPLLPIHEILFGILIIAFLVNIITMIFKGMEIKVSETGSQKFLLAHGSMKAAVSTLVIAIIFAVLLFYVPGAPWAQDIVDSTEKGSIDPSSTLKTSFRSQDEFLVTHTRDVTAKVKTNGPINASVHLKSAYDNNDPDSMIPGSEVNDLYPSSGGSVMEYKFPVSDKMDYGQYYIVINSKNEDQESQVEITINREIDTGLTNDLLMFCVLFAIVNGVWAGVCAGIKSKQKGESIYT